MADQQKCIRYCGIGLFLGILIMSIALLATSFRRLESDEGKTAYAVYLAKCNEEKVCILRSSFLVDYDNLKLYIVLSKSQKSKVSHFANYRSCINTDLYFIKPSGSHL